MENTRLERDRWGEVISQFEDATIYQSWSYGGVVRGAKNISHLVLRRKDEIVGCCQVTTRVLPLIGLRVADVSWGPLWRRKGSQLEPDIFRQLIRGLREHYGRKAGNILRVWPNATREYHEVAKRILESEGFERNLAREPFRTLRLDLSPSLEDLRRNLSQKWRNGLNRAEKNGLTLVEGTRDEHYRRFLVLAKEMLARKKFTPGVDYDKFRLIQEDLPEPLKMRIMVCEFNGQPMSVAIFSAIGDTGIYLLGATGDKGLGLNGAYLSQWGIIQRLKELGLRWYDLGGIDRENNPGVYEFKRGIIGKQIGDEEFLGEFEGCFNLQSRVNKVVLNFVRSVRRRVKDT